MRYFDINLPFSLIYSRILIAYIIVLLNTGKSFSEALILESTNPQYDKRLFMELPWKLQASYCGLINAKIRASDKDVPVLVNSYHQEGVKHYVLTNWNQITPVQ